MTTLYEKAESWLDAYVENPDRMAFERHEMLLAYVDGYTKGYHDRCQDTTPTTSPAKSATEPASETRAVLDALATKLRGEETSTESGTTESVSSQKDSPHTEHVIPVPSCTGCYYADGRLKGFTYRK